MNIDHYVKVQSIAKNVLSELGKHITPYSTEKSIAMAAEHLLTESGISETWYHNVPALVLLGERSCLSISGKEYYPSDEPVGEINLVTVDLSPCFGNVWGDCARSFVIEDGIYKKIPDRPEFSDGLEIELNLHKKMKEFVSPETKFSDLYKFGNTLISHYGWENLDFLQNLGHSIETNLLERRFIDKNCHEQLGSASFYTFEPHIRQRNGKWGFKHENIYYFNTVNEIVEL